MIVPCFLDTNVLLYSISRDPVEATKRDIAQTLLDTEDRALSVQVLQEFYVNATRKLASPVAVPIAREVVETYGTWIRAATTSGTTARSSAWVAVRTASGFPNARNSATSAWCGSALSDSVAQASGVEAATDMGEG